jgi:hypothetical protein
MDASLRAAAETLQSAAFDRGHRCGYLLGHQHAMEVRRVRRAVLGITIFAAGALAGIAMVVVQ